MVEDEQRLDAAEPLARRLDRPMGLLSIIFLLVVLAQLLVTDPTGQVVLSVINWVFWGIFVPEFILRAYIARFQARFWRKNWWQSIFLALPSHASSERYGHCGSYASQDSAGCSRRESAVHDLCLDASYRTGHFLSGRVRDTRRHTLRHGRAQDQGKDFTYVRPTHEEEAAFMATAHAKFTGEVGVCVATSRPAVVIPPRVRPW